MITSRFSEYRTRMPCLPKPGSCLWHIDHRGIIHCFSALPYAAELCNGIAKRKAATRKCSVIFESGRAFHEQNQILRHCVWSPRSYEICPCYLLKVIGYLHPESHCMRYNHKIPVSTRLHLLTFLLAGPYSHPCSTKIALQSTELSDVETGDTASHISQDVKSVNFGDDPIQHAS
jgi:hypothetical protein